MFSKILQMYSSKLQKIDIPNNMWMKKDTSSQLSAYYAKVYTQKSHRELYSTNLNNHWLILHGYILEPSLNLNMVNTAPL